MTQKIIQTTEQQLSVARATIKQQEVEIEKLRLALSKLQRPTNTKELPGVKKHTPFRHNRLSSSSEDDRPQAERRDLPSFARSTRASLLRRSQKSSTSDGTSTPPTSVLPSSSSSGATRHAPQRVTFAGTAYTYQSGKLGPGGPNYLRSTVRCQIAVARDTLRQR
ncbi:hypothetical protein DHEL01_v205649 [Diaporthe helianthi]|uniref:Uncharacterized protein n=1 Tax=Diaporthe helianthi TaxID=158607 RepID=A0A2P5I0E3_DIAHE|nr:hypothetical protein DHEL01_v205649 [Diaporthe helianthi]